MKKALGAASSNSVEDKKFVLIAWSENVSTRMIFSLIRRSIKPKQIVRAPILGRPRLFGGKLLDYIEVTEQAIPLVLSSCVSAINRLGLHNQVTLLAFFSSSRMRDIWICLGHFSCTRFTSGNQSIQRRFRKRRRSIGQCHRSWYEFRGWNYQIIFSRIKRTTLCTRYVRWISFMYW